MIAVLSLLGLLLISEADSEADKQAEVLPSLSPMEVVKTRLFYQVRSWSEYLLEVSHIYYYQIYFGFLAVCGSQVVDGQQRCSIRVMSCQGLLVNWQKSFGLGLITSDEFHANIGIFTNICNGACRILWGLLFDRIGYRKCFLIIGTFVSIGVTSLPLLKYLGEAEDRKIHNFY